MNDLQERNNTIRYFHAYGKVCLTIVGQRILRSPFEPALNVTLVHSATANPTNMWAVGMALCLPAKRDTGTRRRGKAVAEGRARAQLDEVCGDADKLPLAQLEWEPFETGVGQFPMTTTYLDTLLNHLRYLESESTLGVRAISHLIESSASSMCVALLQSLQRIRKLAMAHDGAGLYRKYKQVFDTGHL